MSRFTCATSVSHGFFEFLFQAAKSYSIIWEYSQYHLSVEGSQVEGSQVLRTNWRNNSNSISKLFRRHGTIQIYSIRLSTWRV